ncbi:hypothetical protein, partial [Oceaniferula flava]|uniref:hypothetical protein n=1 Tax=Oceaniferula flava TaxID=2800421 RepID=UPI002868064D
MAAITKPKQDVINNDGTPTKRSANAVIPSSSLLITHSSDETDPGSAASRANISLYRCSEDGRMLNQEDVTARIPTKIASMGITCLFIIIAERREQPTALTKGQRLIEILNRHTSLTAERLA